METLEFIIHPNGRVEERVTGISGSSCAEVTAAIEAKLGIVATRELTSEHYQNVTSSNLTNNISVQKVRDFSNW
jgi:hypothetical protein